MSWKDEMKSQKTKFIDNPNRVNFDADDEEGQWITTENGHKVHINGEGVPDKGNPKVVEVMTGGSSPKERRAARSKSLAKSLKSDKGKYYGKRPVALKLGKEEAVGIHQDKDGNYIVSIYHSPGGNPTQLNFAKNRRDDLVALLEKHAAKNGSKVVESKDKDKARTKGLTKTQKSSYTRKINEAIDRAGYFASERGESVKPIGLSWVLGDDDLGDLPSYVWKDEYRKGKDGKPGSSSSMKIRGWSAPYDNGKKPDFENHNMN